MRLRSASTATEWNKLITDPHHPLMNKAIQDQLAPGSTFKIIMSAAGLQEGVAQDMRVNCVGGADFYGRFFHCDHHHGLLTIHEAIPMSCDTFFYTLAQRLGIDTIARYATSLGLASKTGIDLPNEMSGVMPSTQWEMKNYHQKYYAGNTISVGIGQGETQVTPDSTAAGAQRHCFERPHGPSAPGGLRSASGAVPAGGAGLISRFGRQDVPLNDDTWMTITEGMAAATTPGLYHTAEGAHIEGVDFAGKTGTAQVVGGGDTHVKGGAKTPNSWFVGMVPRRNPEIAIVVLQEHGDWGSLSAKVAQAIVTTYVNKKRRQDHNLLQQAGSTKPVEVGALWTAPGPSDQSPSQADALRAGHYFIDANTPFRALAAAQTSLPALFAGAPLRWRERLP